ncbi:BCCT family transporter [Oceanibacterium hippocampi]|uniref:Glycine betaine transporter OpuD n=1 Tax=Oceanibacterium hippocampi TaxID=745714 RepID=A0A1Y5SJV8_9PROT|nr:BCCT family transporter [Oceanibacterium hippocampi]SLN42496.1 Glycine betaine transporter OpuD [Oceanibacterium hippocampi]
MRDRYETEYEIGQDNLKVYGMDIHNPVFWITSILILVFVVGSIAAPESANGLFNGAKGWSIDNFDWLFMLGGNIFVLFCLALIVLPVGKIRLGGEAAKPEFSRMSWFAMLFAAGMGIGLMFWSVAEPAGYYTEWYGSPFNEPGRTPEAAQMAMGATMFHWGLHPWAIYAVVGLSLAFFTYNKGLPLTIRSGFYPLLGERTWGWFGHVIDIFAVLATIFGLATSLGFGAQQAASGLHFLFDFDNTIGLQIAIIVAVTAVALISVIRGLDGGVKLLSNINMLLALALLAFVILIGPTLAIVQNFFSTAVSYAQNIIPLSNWIGREDDTFYHGWTVFYWAWWISWSPFVGMFIARISKGRTVREFITAVLLVPTLVTMVWMASFGGAGLEQIQAEVGALAGGIGEVSLALFQMLENLPLVSITSFLAIVLVLVFFITSSDSGSLVIDSITSGGKVDAPVAQRIFWATLEGVIAAALLYGGGGDALGALQAAAITVGLPFTVVLIAMCVSLYMGLSHEKRYVLAEKPA